MLPAAFLIAVLVSDAPAARQNRSRPKPPPGLVLVDGGPTTVGTPAKYVEEMTKRNVTLLENLACETPQHEEKLPDFFLMVTEVTNEQYAAYVQATGARPPEHWATEVIDAASLEHSRRQGELREKAKAERHAPPEAEKFDRAVWWRDHWRGKAWRLPTGKEADPVVYVDYDDAERYAHWAGLRLMSEFEFQRAGRRNSERIYPWGDEPDRTRAAVQELRVDGKEVRLAAPMPVASFPSGAVEGIYDLTGNVWEWTSSPFVAYPGWKVLKVTLGAGPSEHTVEGLVSWKAEQRVVVSGCYETGFVTGRLSARRPTDRDQSTGGLGFRCAASAKPGLDQAASLVREVPSGSATGGVEFDQARAVVVETWSSVPGSAKTRQGASVAPVPDYAVITSYDRVLYVPSSRIEAASREGLVALSHRSGTVSLGILSTTKPVLSPPLAAGTYVVGFRGAGGRKPTLSQMTKEREDPSESEGSTFRAPDGFDSGTDALIFYDLAGDPQAWMPAPEMAFAFPAEQKATLGKASGSYALPGDDGASSARERDATLVTLQANSLVRVPNKGFAYALPLVFRSSDVNDAWR